MRLETYEEKIVYYHNRRIPNSFPYSLLYIAACLSTLKRTEKLNDFLMAKNPAPANTFI